MDFDDGGELKRRIGREDEEEGIYREGFWRLVLVILGN